MSVCLYTKIVKTDLMIGPKLFLITHMTPAEKVYGHSKLKNLQFVKVRQFKQKNRDNFFSTIKI